MCGCVFVLSHLTTFKNTIPGLKYVQCSVRGIHICIRETLNQQSTISIKRMAQELQTEQATVDLPVFWSARNAVARFT